ncbi:MAG: SDR family oxidoreductase [Pseudomonadota bacterium]
MPTLSRFGLDNKIVIVTGAGRGIGRVIAKEAVQSGAKLAVGSRSTDELVTLAEEINDMGGQCMFHPLDVVSVGSIQLFMNAVVDHYGQIDVLINNAGYNKFMPMLDYDEATYDQIVDANLKNVFFCCQTAARYMIERGNGGAIVNVSSQAGMVGAPDRAPYSGAKAGVNNLTRTMAAEWAEHRIRVNAVAPTATRTPLGEQSMKDSATFREGVQANILLRGDLAEPEEISAPIIFLASEAASMITGHTLVVDGGWTIT